MTKYTLRKPTWQGDAADARDVAEHLRDIQAVIEQMIPMRLVKFTNITYQPPLTVESATRPEAVLCVRAENMSGAPLFPGNQTDWSWNGSVVKVTFPGFSTAQRIGALKLLLIG